MLKTALVALLLLLLGALSASQDISDPEITRLTDDEYQTLFDALNGTCVTLLPAESGFFIEGEGFGRCTRPSSCGCVEYTCQNQTECRERNDLMRCNSTDGTQSCLTFGSCSTQPLFNVSFTLAPELDRNTTCNLDQVNANFRDVLESICEGLTCRVLLSRQGFDDEGSLLMNGRASESCLRKLRDNAFINFTAGDCGSWRLTSILIPADGLFSENLEVFTASEAGFLGSNVEALIFQAPLNFTVFPGKVLIIVPEAAQSPLDVCNIRARTVDSEPLTIEFNGQQAIYVPTKFATFGDLFRVTLIGSFLPSDLRNRLAKTSIETLVRQTCADIRNNSDPNDETATTARVFSLAAVAAEGDTNGTDFLPLCRAKWNAPENGSCPLNPNCPSDRCYYCGSVETCVRPSFSNRDVCTSVADVFSGVNLQEACCEHDMCFVNSADRAGLQRCNLDLSGNLFQACKAQLCGNDDFLGGIEFLCEATCRALSTAVFAILAGSTDIGIINDNNLGLQTEYNALCDCGANDGTTSLPADQWVTQLDENRYDVVANCTINNQTLCDEGLVDCNGTCVNATCCPGFRACAGGNGACNASNETVCIPDTECCADEKLCFDAPSNSTNTTTPATCVPKDACCPTQRSCELADLDLQYCADESTCCITERLCGDGSCVNATDLCPEETRICDDGRRIDPNRTCCLGEFRNATTGECELADACAGDCNRNKVCTLSDGNITCVAHFECCEDETPCGFSACCSPDETCNLFGQCQRVLVL